MKKENDLVCKNKTLFLGLGGKGRIQGRGLEGPNFYFVWKTKKVRVGAMYGRVRFWRAADRVV